MQTWLLGSAVALVVAVASVSAGRAENPVIQTRFTADPAPLVHDGVVYLYTGHDEDDAQGFLIRDWRLYSSTDMVNWTDKGVVASLATFPWAMQDNDAWAAQVVARDGKFYLYATLSVAGDPKTVIGVAVADRPEGPFRDMLGHPLLGPAVGYIDPTVFVDDDGQAHLYWGNPDLWHVRLNRDMVSTSGPVVKIASKPADYQEGPWFYKRAGRYYMAYASTCCPEGIGYAMSASPTGPWVRKGSIMDGDPRSTGNHPGIIDYKGNSYVFGFNYRLNFAMTPIHHERRSVTVAKIDYAADGTIAKLPWWNTTGVAQLAPIDPYRRVEAETIAWTSRIKRDRDRPIDWWPGIRTERTATGDTYVTRATDLDYIKVADVDFGKVGPAAFEAMVAGEAGGGTIELHVDAPEGPEIGAMPVTADSGPQRWQVLRAKASPITGRHDLFVVFRGSGGRPIAAIDWWRFAPWVATA